MAKKLLIDAAQPEEIRVAVVNKGILEEFESETLSKRQLKGNIYLAKIVRIEPSLQAAFVEYGGNKHGFLPFSEIHPDYYRIPISDREALLTELKQTAEMHSEEGEEKQEDDLTTEETFEVGETSDEELSTSNQKALSDLRKRGIKYKIQEVITHRQIMLIQVVKEERGGKGAALTTYLSLPGRYCVLMPNAAHHAGGISRKIQDGEDRKRLRELVKDLETPLGMALIVRTAGQNRNKMEIKRDFEYLMRLWNEIRELTLESVAPQLVYAEGDLVKRAIRDIYSKEVDEILIEGEQAHKKAKEFMKTLMPSHIKKVKLYQESLSIPLFHHYKIEEQIDKVMDPVVHLPSGGSIVINQTEALVAIDVNSGKSTRERNIDETALKTNLEAAEEITRQICLRDLGGIIVIDFIDMYEEKYVQQVEKKFRDTLKFDRARLQIGHISQFGLLELSRQRLKPSVLETQAVECIHCKGTGRIRSVESMALRVLRAIESLAFTGKSKEILAFVPLGVELYLLNQKRSNIVALENRFHLSSIQIQYDHSLISPHYRIEAVSSHLPHIKEQPSSTSTKKQPQKKPLKMAQKNKNVESQQQPIHQEKKKNGSESTIQEMIVADLDTTATTPPNEEALNPEEQLTHGGSPKNKRYRHKNHSRYKKHRKKEEGLAAPSSAEVSPVTANLEEKKAPDVKDVPSTDTKKTNRKSWLRRLIES